MKRFLFEREKIGLFLFAIVATIFASCSKNDGDNKSVAVYDPNKPIEVSALVPDSGGMGTRIIINGANFGSDTSKIRVYFNSKRAPVVSSNGNLMYALAPRLPGDTCVISVKVGTSTIIAPVKFRYKSGYRVSTICGQKGTTADKQGTLATATFYGLSQVGVDLSGNIFATGYNGSKPLSIINEANNSVTWGFSNQGNLNSPTIDPVTQIVYIPDDAGLKYYECNPVNLWMGKMLLIVKPNAAQILAGMQTFVLDWKHSLAFCDYDGLIYTRDPKSDIICFDPLSKVGRLVAKTPQTGNGDSYLIFDKVKPYLLYWVNNGRHCIYSLDVRFPNNPPILVAGADGVAGYRDGKLLDAEFKGPRQVCAAPNGDLFIADSGNNCIRRVSITDGMVSTVIGIGNKAGYKDGDPSEALFDDPRGVAIDKYGFIYIADRNNNCVRKLTMQ